MFYHLLVNINDYTKVKKIGTGTYGKVLLIKDKKMGKLYAAKVFKNPNSSMEDIMSFYKEIDLQLTSKGPETLKIVGFSPNDFKGKNRPTIIMEYMIDSLKTKITELEDPKKYFVIFGVAHALKHIHKLKLMHLNLKPSNILLDPHSYPRICDFFAFSNDKIRNNMDLSIYIAPEILNGKNPSSKSDVYSFGIIAYEIMTGKLIQHDPLHSIPQYMIPDLSIFDDEVIQKFFMKCLSSNPKDRYTFKEICTLLCQDNFRNRMNVQYKDLQEYYTFLYKKKADDGNVKAMNCYACMLEQGFGYRVDEREIIKYYEWAVEKEDPKALFNYARLNFFGIKDRIKPDIPRSIDLYEKAIAKGNSYAMNNYAFMCFYGEGVPVNQDKALFLFKMAAFNGNVYAMSNLAFFYRSGFRIPVNKAEAAELYEKVIQLDPTRVNSIRCLAEMHRYREIQQANINDAIRLYKMAIDKDDDIAMCELADMYHNGEIVPPNIEDAKNLYLKAINLGNKSAVQKYNDLLEKNKGEIAGTKIKEINLDVAYVQVVEFYDGVPIKKPKVYYYKSYNK